jgi:hypothetical protein
MEKMRKAISWMAVTLCAVSMLLAGVVPCTADETEPQIPVGSRVSVCLSDVSEVQGAHGESKENADETFSLNSFLSSDIHPGATHQVVEGFPGPVGIPLVDGRIFLLPPGLYVRLEDTSIWRILDEDIWAMQDWLPSDSLHLTQNKTWFTTRYQYCLCNLNTQVKVRVSPEVGPKLTWSLRRFIYDRSLIAQEIILNDGSLWKVSSADAGVFSHWLPDDSVIIGVNTDWMSFRRPNIIINLTTNDYVRCSWIR